MDGFDGKCPKYITNLPYGNATTVGELSKRIDTINQRIDEEYDKIDEHESIIKEENDLISDLEKDNKNQEKDKVKFQKDIDDFEKLDKKILNEKLNKAKEIGGAIDDLVDNIQDMTDGYGLNKTHEKMFNKLSSIQGYFYGDSSILSETDVKEINKLADDYVDYLDNNGQISFNKTEYKLGDDIRGLTDNPKSLINAEEKSRVANAMIIESDNIILSNNKEIKNSQERIAGSEREISKSEQRINNYNIAYDKAKDKMDKIKNGKSFNVLDYKRLIADSLYHKGLIDEELYHRIK